MMMQRRASARESALRLWIERDVAHDRHLVVTIDLGRIRSNVEAIRQSCRVPVMPVVKADAYGLGMLAICDCICDLASAFCVFQLEEAVRKNLAARTGRRVLALGPPSSLDPEVYLTHRVTPSVADVESARLLRKARPALCVDTGMQRFSCPADQIERALRAGECTEIFAHGTRKEHAARVAEVAHGRDAFRHVAASALLLEPDSHLDAVRPGLAMYEGAVEAAIPLHEVHRSAGPAGYSEFEGPYHGVILAGYAQGLRKGPCLINGRLSRIVEVGMQSAYVSTAAQDRPGDKVMLLGHELTASTVAAAWGTSPHEVLISLTREASRVYRY